MFLYLLYVIVCPHLQKRHSTYRPAYFPISLFIECSTYKNRTRERTLDDRRAHSRREYNKKKKKCSFRRSVVDYVIIARSCGFRSVASTDTYPRHLVRRRLIVHDPLINNFPFYIYYHLLEISNRRWFIQAESSFSNLKQYTNANIFLYSLYEC